MEVTSRLVELFLVAVLLFAGHVSGDFAYGVNVPNTGDVKAHRQSETPDGRTEGEYRWLQPNGLYWVTRYFVDGDSGYQAVVSEEPGEPVRNLYTNSVHESPRTFITSQINNNKESDNIHQGLTISLGTKKQSLVNNQNAQSKFQNRLSLSNTHNKILPDATIVGEDDRLTSNTFTPQERFKRNGPSPFFPFTGSSSQSSARGFGGQSSSESFSRSGSNSFGSRSRSQSGSRANISGVGGTSRSQSFSRSSSRNVGSNSHSQSFSRSGSSPSRVPGFGATSFSRASAGSGLDNGFGAQSSSNTFSQLPGFGANSFSRASAGSGLDNGFGAQSSSNAFSRLPGSGSNSFSRASAGSGFDSGFGAQSSSNAFSRLPDFGANSFSKASAGSGFDNGFGAQSSSNAFVGVPGFGF